MQVNIIRFNNCDRRANLIVLRLLFLYGIVLSFVLLVYCSECENIRRCGIVSFVHASFVNRTYIYQLNW
jgi:hypothetical protein